MKPDLHSNLASNQSCCWWKQSGFHEVIWIIPHDFITFHMSTSAGFSCGLDSPTLDLPRMSVPRTSAFPCFLQKKGVVIPSRNIEYTHSTDFSSILISDWSFKMRIFPDCLGSTSTIEITCGKLDTKILNWRKISCKSFQDKPKMGQF